MIEILSALSWGIMLGFWLRSVTLKREPRAVLGDTLVSATEDIKKTEKLVGEGMSITSIGRLTTNDGQFEVRVVRA